MSNAQDIDFGAKAGLNLASFGGDNDGTEGAIGFYIGGFVEFDINDKFQIQPELLFSQEGAQLEQDDDGELAFSYLRLPIMAKYMVADGLDIVAGPQIGFMIDDADADVETFDFGVGVGLAYELESGIGFDVRYNLGLSNLSKVDGFDINQNNLMLGVNYAF